MVILALDTSSASGSAAVARDGAILAEQIGDGTRTHGERLPRELMTVLDTAGLSIRDVDRFAVSVGPGSFTGLRVGIATIQGLAVAGHTPVVPISTFEALATVTRASERVAVWIDAHRGEVFATLYGPDAAAPPIEIATSLTPDATLDRWGASLAGAPSIHFAGDGALKYADAIRARLGSRAILPGGVPPLAGVIAGLAFRHPERAVAPHAVVPLYVRRSDAELARDRRQAAP